jgi:hypothetical protein
VSAAAGGTRGDATGGCAHLAKLSKLGTAGRLLFCRVINADNLLPVLFALLMLRVNRGTRFTTSVFLIRLRNDSVTWATRKERSDVPVPP